MSQQRCTCNIFKFEKLTLYFPHYLNTSLKLKINLNLLETWNLVRKYTHICSVRKYTFYYQDPILLMLVFPLQKIYIFGKNSTFTKSISFLKQKVNIDGNVSIIDHASKTWLLDFSRLALNWKTDNVVTSFWHDIIVKMFWHWRVSLVNFSYWSKFHVSIITGSGVMTIFAYKGLTRNLEIRNTPVWVLPNVRRQEWVMDTKFCKNISD